MVDIFYFMFFNRLIDINCYEVMDRRYLVYIREKEYYKLYGCLL